MPIEYANFAPAQRRIAARFCLVTFGGGVAGFLAWCAVDFTLVRLAPSHIHDFGWLLLLFPPAVGFAGLAILRQRDSSPRIGLAILAAIIASIVAVIFVLFLGLSFHDAIGGTFP